MASRGGGRTLEEWIDLVGALLLLAFGWAVVASVVDQFVLRPIWTIAHWLGHPLGQDVRTALTVVTASELCLAYVVLFFWDKRQKERAHRERQTAMLAVILAFRTALTALKSIPAEVVMLSPPELPAIFKRLDDPQFTEPTPSVPAAPEPEAPATTQSRLGCYRPFVVADEKSALPPPEPRKAPEPQPFELTRAEWDASSDPCALLCHAIPRIPVRHTCLVLSQLAGGCWPHWNRCFPNDWRPAWSLMLLRAWSLGEASRTELAAARDAARVALEWARRQRNLGPSRLSAYAAVRAIDYAHWYAQDSEADRLGPFPAFKLLAWISLAMRDEDLSSGFDLDAPRRWTYADPQPSLEQIALRRARRLLAPRRSVRIATRLRTWIPYPSRASTEWRRIGNWIRAGDASLFLDGSRIASSRPLTPDLCPEHQ